MWLANATSKMPLHGHEHPAVVPLLPETSSPHQKLSIDQLLQAWVGEFGRAQLLHFTLVSLEWCLQSLLTFVMVFSDHTPSWLCASSSSLNITSALPHQGYVHPNVLLSYPMHVSSQGSPSCNSSSSICDIDASLWVWVGGKAVSTVSQWGLICDQSYKVSLVQSLFFTGALLGAGVCGSLSDSFLGRKGVLLVTSGLCSLLSLLTAFAPNYWVYLALRMATGFNCGGVGPVAFVLATEIVGPSKRGPASMSIFFFYSLGIILLSTLAYFISSWRHLYLLSAALFFLYCLLVLPFLSESPRWYLAHGRADDALAILKQIALKNGKTIPSTITLETEHTRAEDAYGERAKSQANFTIEPWRKATMMDVFRVSTTRRRMVIMLFIWLSNGLCYYGVNLDVPNLGGNISIGLILNAVGEMPAYVISAMMLQRYGRRPVLVCALLVSGMSCLGGAVMGTSAVRTACAVVAIFGAAASYNLVFIYTAELFPTEVRSVALGLGSQAAQVGAIASPVVAVLAGIHGWLPFSIFCTTALLGSCLACWLPETLEKPMYETIHGMLK